MNVKCFEWIIIKIALTYKEAEFHSTLIMNIIECILCLSIQTKTRNEKMRSIPIDKETAPRNIEVYYYEAFVMLLILRLGQKIIAVFTCSNLNSYLHLSHPRLNE